MVLSETRLLIACIIIDLIGSISLLLPFIGDGMDAFWAPISAFILRRLFPDPRMKNFAYLQLIEELAPGAIDLIPTATLAWLVNKYFINKDRRQEQAAHHHHLF